MATAPDTDLRTHLIANVGTCTSSNTFAGGKRATDANAGVPEQAVFCLATGGAPPEADIDNGADGEWRFSGVQITIRSNPHEFEGGQTLARAIRDALHHSPPSGYVEAEAQESEPLYLGMEDNGNHVWTVNVMLRHRQ